MNRLANLKSILALSLVLRIAFLILAGVNAPLGGDELAYNQIAANVASGHGFVQDNNPFFPGQTLYAWQAPLYPLSLAALYFVFGPDPLVARLFGVLVGVATVFLTFDLARRTLASPSVRIGRTRRIALVAALFVAIYPGLLTLGHLLLSETLFTFFVVLTFDLIAAALETQNHVKDASPSNPLAAVAHGSGAPVAEGTKRLFLLVAAAGAAWGAATLTRGIALYFALPLIVWLGASRVQSRFSMWRTTFRRNIPSQLGAILGPVAVFLLSMAAVIAPWTARNYAVFHLAVLLETKGGVNFWLGNSPYTPDDFIRNVWKTGVREPMLAVLPSDEVARDAEGYRLGESFVVQNPLTFLERMPIKFADFWGFERNLVDAAEATRTGKPGGWNSPSKLAADFFSDAAYVLLVILALGGLVLDENRWKALIGGFILYFVFVHMVVFGDGRFHLPLIPFLALYAAWFAVNIAERSARLREGAIRNAIALAFALIFAGVWARELFAAWTELRKGL